MYSDINTEAKIRELKNKKEKLMNDTFNTFASITQQLKVTELLAVLFLKISDIFEIR